MCTPVSSPCALHIPLHTKHRVHVQKRTYMLTQRMHMHAHVHGTHPHTHLHTHNTPVFTLRTHTCSAHSDVHIHKYICTFLCLLTRTQHTHTSAQCRYRHAHMGAHMHTHAHIHIRSHAVHTQGHIHMHTHTLAVCILAEKLSLGSEPRGPGFREGLIPTPPIFMFEISMSSDNRSHVPVARPVANRRRAEREACLWVPLGVMADWPPSCTRMHRTPWAEPQPVPTLPGGVLGPALAGAEASGVANSSSHPPG